MSNEILTIIRLAEYQGWQYFIALDESWFYLSTDYFLNSAHRSLKYAIQFLLIQTAQNRLQALKNWSSSAR
jgi:hypothetical protein